MAFTTFKAFCRSKERGVLKISVKTEAHKNAQPQLAFKRCSVWASSELLELKTHSWALLLHIF